MRVAAFGGPYSNPYALRALLDDAPQRGCERIFCLGDFGGFGAEPDAVCDLLRTGAVECIAGNYDVAIGHGDPDCGCGYRDPIDNRFAQVAYDFTKAHTSPDHAAWMDTLPTERRETIEGVDVHLVHGSPLGLNDFFWESLPDHEMRARVAESGADVVLCTHSGLPWQRRVGESLVVNVGVLGRPANDGGRNVWYAVVDLADGQVDAELVPLDYDWAAQAASMREAGLPEAFTETIETGWWTTCLQILPPAERARGRFQLYRSDLAPHATVDGLEPPPPDDPQRPVVGVFGSALFPRRLRIDDATLEGDWADTIEDEACASGFVEIEKGHAAGDGPHVGSGENGDDVPNLLVNSDGWFWHPAAPEPLAPTLMPVTRVKAAVVERILSRALADGSLPRPFACVTAGEP